MIGSLPMPAAEVAFERPEAGDDGGWNAELLLDTIEGVAVALDLSAAVGEPVRRRELGREVDEALGKEALLAIAGDDRLVEGHAVRVPWRCAGADALGGGLTAETGHPAVEVPTCFAVAAARAAGAGP